MNNLSKYTDNELLAELRSRRNIIAVKVWDKGDVEDWLDSNLPDASTGGMDYDEFTDKVVESALDNKDNCNLKDCTDDEWAALDHFMGKRIEECGGKWPNVVEG